MSGSDELYPPAQYEGGWIALAIVILLLLILAAWLLVYLTRPRRSLTRPETPPPGPPPDLFTQLRYEYFTRIDQIEAEYAAGNLTPRAASLALSRSVRAFVNEYSGLEAPVMTLEELEDRGVHPALLEAVRTHYVTIFRREPLVDPSVGATAARTVVNTWH